MTFIKGSLALGSLLSSCLGVSVLAAPVAISLSAHAWELPAGAILLDDQIVCDGRPKGPHGSVWHLVDRKRNMWRLSNVDNDQYESPFFVAGFARGGKAIVGYDHKRLFVFPTDEVYNNDKVR